MFRISKIHDRDLGSVVGEVELNNLYELAGAITAANWSPALFTGRRTIASAVSLSLLVFDVDSGCSLEQAKEEFKDFQYIIAPTKSHRKLKNGVIDDRFRVIIPLQYPITNDEDYKATFEFFRQRWPFVDPACKDISRFFYPCSKDSIIKEEGALLEPKKAQPKPKPQLLKTVGASTKHGQLFNSTLQFLLHGAEPGHRHNALVKAVINMREQNYTEDEVIAELEGLIEKTGDDCWTDASSLKTISDIYKRELKGEYRPIEEPTEPTYILASELFNESMDYLADKDRVKGDSTGLAGLDKLLGGGCRYGELTVLMAQAKTGKNALYHYLLYHKLITGQSAGYASRELDPAREVIPNLLAISLGLNTWKADVTPDFKEKAKAELARYQLYFAPGYGHFPIDEMKRWFETLTSLGVKHFWMDHFHYMLDVEDYLGVSKTIKQIKTMAKQFDVHINLIVQPKNLMEGQRLSMDSLKGGSAINQALDNLLILERIPEHKNISRLRLEVARHKLARPGDMFLKYDPNTTRFEEVEFDPTEANVTADLKEQAFAAPTPRHKFGLITSEEVYENKN